MSERFQIRDRRRLDSEGNLKQEILDKPRSEQKTKREPPPLEAPQAPPSEADFTTFLMNLSTMAYGAMGLLPNSKRINLEDAQYVIDTIAMLEGKTRGNLTHKEHETLRSLLYELRMNYARLIERTPP